MKTRSEFSDYSFSDVNIFWFLSSCMTGNARHLWKTMTFTDICVKNKDLKE